MNTRAILLAGFGGLLLLTALAGIDGIKALQDIETSNDRIREDFLLRTRVLEQIRTDVYRSGTDIRDYLLEPESGRAEGHRYTLVETRKDVDAALTEYRRLLSPNEVEPFAVLTRELADYWQVLEPTFEWTPAERREAGYAFLRDEVYSRRTSMLAIATQIGRLNEAQLDAGRRNVQLTFAALRSRLIFAIAVTMGLGFLLAWFTSSRILKLEDTDARRQAELKQLSTRLLDAQEDERRSISRELHDEVGQSLSGVLFEMANLTNLIKDSEPAAQKSAEIKRQLEESIRVVRNMALLLRPSMLDDLGLVPALQWQAREASKRNGVWVNVTAENIPDDLREDYKTCVYRIVQEALHNVVQHAEASKVEVRVVRDQQRLLLSIADDGRGFDAKMERGMGLVGMQERVASLGGRVRIESAPGKGTVLRVELPAA
jgi:signal transduction histidine kinase